MSLQHLALVGSYDFWRFLGLFCMNPWKFTRKVDRQTNTLEFSRAIFSTLQTKSIDTQTWPWLSLDLADSSMILIVMNLGTLREWKRASSCIRTRPTEYIFWSARKIRLPSLIANTLIGKRGHWCTQEGNLQRSPGVVCDHRLHRDIYN